MRCATQRTPPGAAGSIRRRHPHSSRQPTLRRPEGEAAGETSAVVLPAISGGLTTSSSWKSLRFVAWLLFCFAQARVVNYSSRPVAGVAQWQSTCFVNRWLGVQVPSSARAVQCRPQRPNALIKDIAATTVTNRRLNSGGLPEWPKGADCKSAGTAFDGSNPSPSTRLNRLFASPATPNEEEPSQREREREENGIGRLRV